MAYSKTIKHLEQWLKKPVTGWSHGILHHNVKNIYANMRNEKRVTDQEYSLLSQSGHWKD